MSDPFLVLDFGSLGRERALVRPEGTGRAALRTGLLGWKPLRLLAEHQLEGSFGQSVGGGGRDLLHGSEIDIQTGSRVAEGAFGHDFPPLGCELSKLIEFLG